MRAAATVVVPTRGRGDRIVRTVSGLLALAHPSFSVLVLDQSDGEASQRALDPLRVDPRLRSERIGGQGIAAALNRGVAAAETEIVAITGDDCDPAPDWLETISDPFERDPRIGLVFGSVLPVPHDEVRGFVPACEQNREVHARSLRDQPQLGGTSACMALRRSVWKELGGLDERLGVGTALGAGEDLDLALRALLAGYHVYATPAARVVHRGFYRWEERAELVRRNWLGTGAAFGKLLVPHPAASLTGVARLAWHWIARGASPVAASLGPGPPRAQMARSFLRGFVAGVRLAPEPGSGKRRRTFP